MGVWGCIQYGTEWVANIYKDGDIYVASMGVVVCIDLDQLSSLMSAPVVTQHVNGYLLILDLV